MRIAQFGSRARSMDSMLKFSKTLLLSIGLGLFAQAQAGTVDCLSSTAALVSNTQDCELSTSANQDFLNSMTVNQEAFFGFNDWELIKKNESPANGQSGSWSLDSSVWDLYTSVMLIFKSGSGTTLVGYLVKDDFTSGSWSSPFRYPQFSGPGMADKKGNAKNPKAVSHISFYGRGEATDVSEPNGLLLLGLGLLALVGIRRRLGLAH